MNAVVNTPVCPLTQRPGSGGPLVDEALLGMTVEVLGEDGAYRYIRTPYRYEGWAPAGCLLGGAQAERWAALPKKAVLGKHICDVLPEAKYQSRPLVCLPMGALVAAPGEDAPGWQAVTLPDARRGYMREGLLGEYRTAPPALPEQALRRLLVDTAMRYRGSQYRWGGKTPAGLDCSGLVSMAYLLCGVVIYRDAKLMDGFPVHEIDRRAMKSADLLFFPGHVAMYIGDGRYCHATGRAGDGGFAVNSLDPAAPDYRADLAGSITAVGSIF